MAKGIGSTGHWYMFDAARSPDNVVNKYFYTDLANAEFSIDKLDFVTGGVKMRSGGGDPNYGTTPYITLTIGIPTIDVDGRILAGR